MPAGVGQGHIGSCNGVLGEQGHATPVRGIEPVRRPPQSVAGFRRATRSWRADGRPLRCVGGGRDETSNGAGQLAPPGPRIEVCGAHDARVTIQEALPCVASPHAERGDGAQARHNNTAGAARATHGYRRSMPASSFVPCLVRSTCCRVLGPALGNKGCERIEDAMPAWMLPFFVELLASKSGASMCLEPTPGFASGVCVRCGSYDLLHDVTLLQGQGQGHSRVRGVDTSRVEHMTPSQTCGQSSAPYLTRSSHFLVH